MKPASVDSLGDPLPDGAIARLGTGRLRHHLGGIRALAFAPDTKLLASCGEDRAVHLWDPETGKEVRRIVWNASHWCLAWSPDGKTLAVGSSEGLAIWDPATGKEKRRFGARDSVRCVTFSSDGRMLAAGGWGNPVHLWNLATNEECHRLGAPEDAFHEITFAPDGKTLVTVGRELSTSLRRWDVNSGQELSSAGQGKDGFTCATFLPDGTVLAANSGDRELQLWDPASGTVLRRFLGHQKSVQAVAVTPDGTTAASASSDGAVRLWDVAKGDEIRKFGPLTRGASHVALSPDGKTLAVSTEDHVIRLWDVVTGKPRLPMTGHRREVISLAFTLDGKTLASAGASEECLQVWNPATGKERRAVGGDRNHFSHLAFTPDGKTVAAWTWNDTISLANVETGKVRQWPMQVHEGGLVGFRFAADGKTLSSIDDNGIIHSWDTATGKRTHKTDRYGMGTSPAAFSPDGKLVATGNFHLGSGGILGRESHRPPNERGLRLFDAARGKELRGLERHDADQGEDPFGFGRDGSLGGRGVGLGGLRDIGLVFAAAFSPDGKTLVSMSDDATVLVWEVATVGERLRFRLPEPFPRGLGGVFVNEGCLAISPDGRFLAAPLKPDVVGLWDLATCRIVTSYRGNAGRVYSLAFAPDGRTIASGHSNTTILLWAVPEMPERPLHPETITDKKLAALWSDLSGNDADKAYRANWCIVAVPDQAVPFLDERLRPVAAPDAAKLARLLADLGDEEFTIRERASQELDMCLETVAPDLRKALDGKLSLEQRKRVEGLLDNLHAWTPERLRAWRSLEVLEHLGTPEAKQILEKLAKGGPAVKLTQEAKAALERLARRVVAAP